MALEIASPLGSKVGPLWTSEGELRHCSLHSPRMQGPSPRQTRDCCSTAVSHCKTELVRTSAYWFWYLTGKECSIMRNRKGKRDNTTQKSNLRLQTDSGVIKEVCKISLLVLMLCREWQVKSMLSQDKIKSCFQRFQVRHVTTQAVVSEVLPPHSPPSQLTHPSVVSCMNSSCQSHESLLLQPYQQQI